jgi:predicted nuclease of predicted toxin-antitoxin system
MKLLIDENLSHLLVVMLADVYPDATHVRLVGLESAADPVVWEYAKASGYTIVSRDRDMQHRSFLYGFPPKVVWLCVSNSSTARIEALLRSRQQVIAAFVADPVESLLVLH